MSQTLNYFIEDENEAWVCNECSQKMKKQSSKTTTHLWNHYKRKHPLIYQELLLNKNENLSNKSLISRKQSSIPHFFRAPISEEIQKRFDDALLEFIIQDGRPFEITSGSGFLHFCKTISNNTYNPPHPTTLSRRLDLKVENLKENIKRDMSNELKERKFSITFDHWRSSNYLTFLVITLHYITLQWELKS